MRAHLNAQLSFQMRDGISLLRNGPPSRPGTFDLFDEPPELLIANAAAEMRTIAMPQVGFHQPTMERELRRRVAAMPGVDVRYDTEVDRVSVAELDEAGGASCVVNIAGGGAKRNQTLRARFCVAADGGSSATRKQLGVRYGGSTWPDQPWLVVDTEISDPTYLRESWVATTSTKFIVNASRPFVFVRTPGFFAEWWAAAEEEASVAKKAAEAAGATPSEAEAEAVRVRDELLRERLESHLSGAGRAPPVPPKMAFRFEFLLDTGTSEVEATSPEYVRALLRDAADVDVDRLDVVRTIVYTFHARSAERWGVESAVFFVGDAAHCMPPFRGQGMNTGVRDAQNLAWKLALVVRGAASRAVLGTYEPERRHEFDQIVGRVTRLGDVVMVRNPALALARDVLARAASAVWHHVLRRSIEEVLGEELPGVAGVAGGFVGGARHSAGLTGRSRSLFPPPPLRHRTTPSPRAVERLPAISRSRLLQNATYFSVQGRCCRAPRLRSSRAQARARAARSGY